MPEAVRARIPSDRWYKVLFLGQHLGWAHEEIRREKDGGILYSSQLKMLVQRQGQDLVISQEDEVRADSQGRPLTFVDRMNSSGQLQSVTGRRHAANFELVRSAGESVEKRKIPAAEGVVSSLLALELFAAQGFDKPREAVVPVIFEEMGSLGEMRFVAKGKGSGRDAASFVVEADMPGGKRIYVLAPDGSLMKSEVPGVMLLELADRESAQNLPAQSDLLADSMIRLSKTIPGARTLRHARFRLNLSGSEPLTLPRDGCQRLEKSGASYVLTLDSPEPGKTCEASSLPGKLCLEANIYEGPGNRKIAAAAEKAAAGAKTVPDRAERLRSFVLGYIVNNNYHSLYATAPEILGSRSGDCTEHSVLLSSLLKAQGIPARWVLGLVHVGNGFLFHEWVEAYSEIEKGKGGWFPLDPSFPESRMDATHIAVAKVCGEEELLQATGAVTGLLGRLKIDLIEAQ